MHNRRSMEPVPANRVLEAFEIGNEHGKVGGDKRPPPWVEMSVLWRVAYQRGKRMGEKHKHMMIVEKGTRQ